MKTHISVKVSMMLLILALFIGCENDPKYNPPEDHTISHEGYMHKSGLDQPLVNCVECHGPDLTGGTSVVSCFECHDTKW